MTDATAKSETVEFGAELTNDRTAECESLILETGVEYLTKIDGLPIQPLTADDLRAIADAMDNPNLCYFFGKKD